MIEHLSAPLCVTWQLTRDCNLGCVHCCTDSAPGRGLDDELKRGEALRLAEDIVREQVPYVMLVGGEPLLCKHFFGVAEVLGRGGADLKIETNGQAFGAKEARRLAKLPIRSIQVSVDGDSAGTYARQRGGGSLEKAHAACRAVREAGMPLEVAFAPTRNNIHEAQAVLQRAASFGAFRFNTGALMRIGKAAKNWKDLEPTEDQYRHFRRMLELSESEFAQKMEVCYLPFTIEAGLRECLAEPPATLMVLPDGKVKVSAALPYTVADLRKQTLAEAWDAYRRAWADPRVRRAAERVLADPLQLREANAWRPLEADSEIVLPKT